MISAQVLNEFTQCHANQSVGAHGRRSRRRFVRHSSIGFTTVVPLTSDTHASAVALARDHSVAFYDALIVAAAIEAGCETLYSEDFQHGRRFGDCTIVNPFL